MNLLDFKQLLAPTLELHEEIEAMETSIKIINNLVNIWVMQLTQGSNNESALAQNKDMFSRIRNKHNTSTFLEYVKKATSHMRDNLQTLGSYAQDNVPNKLFTAAASVKQLYFTACLALYREVLRYLPEYISEQMRSAISESNTEVVFRKNVRINNYLINSKYEFINAIEFAATDPAEFARAFNDLPELPASPKNIQSISLITDTVNPLARSGQNFIGNPIFYVRKVINTLIIDRISYLEGHLKRAKLYREQLAKQAANENSPSLIKEIELLDEDIAILEYKIKRAES